MADIPASLETIEGKYLPFDQQARLFLQPRHIPAIRSLLNFQFQKHPKYNVSDACLTKMDEIIQLRAKRLLEIYQGRKLSQDPIEKKIACYV